MRIFSLRSVAFSGTSANLRRGPFHKTLHKYDIRTQSLGVQFMIYNFTRSIYFSSCWFSLWDDPIPRPNSTFSYTISVAHNPQKRAGLSSERLFLVYESSNPYLLYNPYGPYSQHILRNLCGIPCSDRSMVRVHHKTNACSSRTRQLKIWVIKQWNIETQVGRCWAEMQEGNTTKRERSRDDVIFKMYS